MANMSTYLSSKLVDHTVRNTEYTSPAQTYLGLFTSDAGLADNDALSQTEVSGGAYSRAMLSSTLFKEPVAGSTENSAEISFPIATGTWGSITHGAIMDAAVDGNVLLWGPFTGVKTISTGDSFRVLPNDLDIEFS